jgi:predicted permease
MSDLLLDLRHAVRGLGRAPGFTAAAVLTLALGIGANTAIFSGVKGVLLQPLPYRDAGRLYLAMESSPTGGLRAASYPTFLDWEAQQDAFAAIGYARGRPELYRGADGPENRGVAYVSPGFSEALGLPTALGRPLAPDDAQNGSRAVVLSHRWWRSGFGGDPAVVGRPVTLGRRSYTVVGVAAPAARYPDWADAWIPLAAIEGADPALTQRGLHVDSRVIARLRPGMSSEQAQARMRAIGARLALTYPAESEGWTGVALLPLRTEVMGFDDSAQTRLLVLAGAVVLVLLIACANVTNLLLARALTRGRELTIRVALGARRGRLARQLFTESLVLAGGGGVGGILLAVWGVGLVKGAAPDALPRLEEVRLDLAVLAFSAGLVVMTALLVGMAPALGSSVPRLADSLRSGAAAAAGRAHHRVRQAIVTAEIALAVVLVTGAGLLTASLWRLARVDPGFDPRGVLSIRVTPPLERYPDARGAAEFYRRVLDAALALPGVQSAGLTNHMPLTGGWFPSRVVLPGESPAADRRDDRTIFFRTVSPDYFATMRIPVRHGRPFAGSDLGGAEVAILNETAAQRFFPRGDAVGQAVTLFRSAQGRPDFGEPFAATVVGIVGDVHHTTLDAAPPAEAYVPYTANPWGQVALVVRVAGDPSAMLPSLRRAILAVDPDVPVAGTAVARTTTELVASSLAAQRWNTILLVAFAGTAVVLAAVGIYGVVAYTVAQRRRELGIRLALGARAADVLGLILRQGAVLVAAGAALGLTGAVLGTRVLRGLLYQTTPTDPAILIAGTATLVGVALLASYLPARRAAHVAPMEALRHD